MNWITTDQAAYAAKQGTIPALVCSLEHHQQGRDADWCELKEAIEKNNFDLGIFLCACCRKYSTMGAGGLLCGECPLQGKSSKGGECCMGTYSKSLKAFDILRKDFSSANFEAFQDAEADICRYIEEVLEKERAKEKKPCKCKKKAELSSADYGLDGGEGPYIVLGGRSYWLRDQEFSDYPLAELDGKIGNLLDDLQRNSEDLEGFEVDYATFALDKSTSTIDIQIWPDETSKCFTTLEATEIHQKLGQLLATAKREDERLKRKQK